MRRCYSSRRATTRLFLFAAAMLLTYRGSAQDADFFANLDALDVDSVFAASRFEQPVSDAAASVSIITAEQISEYGYRTFAEALGGLAGFYTTFDDTFSFIGVRGFLPPDDYNSRVLFMINGQRINASVFDMFQPGDGSPVDLHMIERIEVVRGPGSSLYGSNALLAVVNVITRSGRNVDGVEFFASASDGDRYRSSMQWGKRFSNGADIALSLGHMNDDGRDSYYYPEYDDPETNSGRTGPIGDRHSNTINLTGSFNDFTLQAGFSDFETQTAAASYGSIFAEPGNRSDNEFTFFRVGWRHIFPSELDLEVVLEQQDFDLSAELPYEVAAAGGATIRSDIEVASKSRIATLSVNAGKRFGRHNLSFGGSFEDRNPQIYRSSNSLFTFTDLDTQSTYRGLYLQDQISISERLLLTLGARSDDVASFDRELSPRAALIVKLSKHVTTKLLYSEAFRVPNLYERDYAFQSGTAPPLDVLPEHIKTSEWVTEYVNGNRRISTTLFHYELNDLISAFYQSDGSYFFDNWTAPAISNGVELSWQDKIGDFRVSANASFLHTKSPLTNNSLENAPERLANLRLDRSFVGKRINGYLEMRFVGKSRTYRDNLLGSFSLVNLGAQWRLSSVPRLQLGLRARNLFDKRYEHPVAQYLRQSSVLQDGRSITLELTWRSRQQ